MKPVPEDIDIVDSGLYSPEAFPLGVVYQFPTVCHGRASFLHEVGPSILETLSLRYMSGIHKHEEEAMITSGLGTGYRPGVIRFETGIGNGESFSRLDAKCVNSALERVRVLGGYGTIDFLVKARYRLDDGVRRPIPEDHYLVRQVFEENRMDMLLNHQRGMKRIEVDELVKRLMDGLNGLMREKGYGELAVDQILTI